MRPKSYGTVKWYYLKDITESVQEDFYTFKPFEESDFDKHNKLIRSQAILRYIAYKIHQGMEPIDAIKDSLRFNYNNRTFCKIMETYGPVVGQYAYDEFDFEHPKNLSRFVHRPLLENRGEKQTKILYKIYFDIIRGKLKKCEECGRLHPTKNKFCCYRCVQKNNLKIRQAYIEMLENNPEFNKALEHSLLPRKRHSRKLFRDGKALCIKLLGLESDKQYDMLYPVHVFLSEYRNELRSRENINEYYTEYYYKSDEDLLKIYQSELEKRFKDGAIPEFNVVSSSRSPVDVNYFELARQMISEGKIRKTGTM